GFTHVTARRIAQPPEATFVTRLRPARLPGQVARQLPDQSTTLRVEPSSTSDSRLRGARPKEDIVALQQITAHSINSSARASSAGGMMTPIDFAVPRLITSSNRVG